MTTAGPAGAGRFRPTAAPGAGCSTWRTPVDRIGDRAIAGAAAEIAFERARQIVALRLVERGGGHDHAGGAEAALKALRIEKGLLHRMQAVRRAGEPFDRRDAAPLGAERRHEAAMHGLAVEMDGAGAAIAGIAAFLDAEPAELAQEGSQALAGTRRRLVASCR